MQLRNQTLMPLLSYFLKGKLIALLSLTATGVYLFLLHAIIAKPELMEASCFVLLRCPGQHDGILV
jgi:hypothetical protein